MAPLPPIVYRDIVRPEWVDRNGHFNAGFYMVAFDNAITPWFEVARVDMSQGGARTHGTFTAESHALYLSELEPDEPFVVTAQLLAFTDKKIHTFLRMHRAPGDDQRGEMVATNEVLSLYVDLVQRRPATMPAETQAFLRTLCEEHWALGWPPQCGRTMGVDAPRPSREAPGI